MRQIGIGGDRVTSVIVMLCCKQRRQALAGAQSSVNKVAQSVTQTIANVASVAPAAAAAPHNDCGGTWVRDAGDTKSWGGTHKIMGKERSKRRLLLKAARVQLERAQAKVAAKGEHLKKKTDRGLMQAGGSLARGLRKVLPPKDDGKEESELVTNARLLVNCTVSAAEVARARELRSKQAPPGRHAGGQRRAHVEKEKQADEQDAGERAGSATVAPPECTASAERPAAAGESDAGSSCSSLAFDLVSDEELLYAYQMALDAIEASDKADDSEEAEIIALAVSQMGVHPHLIDFAIKRLYELVGLDQGLDGEEDASADLKQLDEAFVKLDASVAATQAPAASAHGDGREGAEDEEFISAVCLNPRLAQRIARH